MSDTTQQGAKSTLLAWSEAPKNPLDQRLHDVVTVCCAECMHSINPFAAHASHGQSRPPLDRANACGIKKHNPDRLQGESGQEPYEHSQHGQVACRRAQAMMSLRQTNAWPWGNRCCGWQTSPIWRVRIGQNQTVASFRSPLPTD